MLATPLEFIFGEGTIHRLRDEVERAGLHRVLVLATPQQREDADYVATDLGAKTAGVFAEARMHTPVDVSEMAVSFAQSVGADGIVAIGGGSTTGLGKAIALRTGLFQIVAPTTYAGSEMTPILGETVDGRKVTKTSPDVLPEVVIYDVDLTLSLSTAASVTSGMNAIAHAVEAMYARDRNPIISLLAAEGIKAMSRALPGIAANPKGQGRRDPAPFTVPGCAVLALGPWAWLCTTSYATPSAACSTFRMPRRTRQSCLIRWRIMRAAKRR